MNKINNINEIPFYMIITPNNCIFFNKKTFNLPGFLNEIYCFFDEKKLIDLSKDLYYAHVFIKDGLLFEPVSFNGDITSKLNYFSLLPDDCFNEIDIKHTFNLHHSIDTNNFIFTYKYNILSLYGSI